MTSLSLRCALIVTNHSASGVLHVNIFARMKMKIGQTKTMCHWSYRIDMLPLLILTELCFGGLLGGQPIGLTHPGDNRTHTLGSAKSLLSLFTELGVHMTRDVLPVPLCSLILRAFKIRSCTPCTVAFAFDYYLHNSS